MHICKFKTGSAPVYAITRTAFEQHTGKLPPFYQEDVQGGNDGKQYAVCPGCDNLVHVIGLYKKLKNTKLPFGRHVPNSIENLASYAQEAYDYCPYRMRQKPHDKSSRKQREEGLPFAIKTLLREQFDRVIYLLQKSTGIQISENLARLMLRTYLSERGHLYTGATMNNLPWIFGYMANAQPLFGRSILRDSPLHKAIEKRCSNIAFEDTGDIQYVKIVRKGKAFINLSFCFTEHKQSLRGENLYESVTLWVHQGEGVPPDTVYRQRIDVDQQHFLNLIHLPQEKARRNHRLLALAAELMG